ncbi:glutamate--tRNA ligase [Candidatus Micrarchaeota archaeon]|nr:glutamate--tRNA ligase [Candidatus Micrarchaeota archaeon]
MDLKKIVKKYALKNALDYGRANPNGVIGKVIAESPDAKKDMRETMKLIAETIAEVNELTKEQVEEQIQEFVFIEKKPEETKKLSLPGCEEGLVVTRFLPEPNGYAHLGHAKAFFLNHQLAKDWSGKICLRFDDTNPETESQEFVDSIKEALAWLGAEFDSQSFTSDSMPKLIDYCKKLISSGDAYFCTCQQEEMRANREAKKACACRSQSVEENLAGWEKMNSTLNPGDATIRLKGDLTALNTVMRDPVLWRIIHSPHYRQGTKYKAWPTYDFEASIMDSISGVTHALRSKEYELRDELYNYILDKLGLRKPVLYDFSRLNIKGTVLSKRHIKPLIEEKKVWGWDDPRLPTIFGLRRRGILPEAIKKFVLSFGLSKVESQPGWDALLTENRKLLEQQAEHYFAVENPVKALIKNAPSSTGLRLAKHPSLEKGTRFLNPKQSIYVSKKDFDELKQGEEVRLKDLYNCIVFEKTQSTIVFKYSGKDLKQNKKLQWVPVEEAIKCELVELSDLFIDEKFNPASLRTKQGFCEKDCLQLEEGQVIQFERIGFCKLDDKQKMRFIISC